MLSAREIADLLGQPHPTQEQTRIIESPLHSMLVVAGAGSGKTETMSARVVWLIANKMVEPQEVLGLTFTRKAAGELLERVKLRLAQLDAALSQRGNAEDLNPEGASAQSNDDGQETDSDRAYDALNRPTISTYNSYAASLVQEHGLRIGREPGARMLSEASQWAIASEIVEKWQGDLTTDSAVSTITRAVLTLAGSLNEHLLSVDEAKQKIQDLIAPLEDIPLAPGRRKNIAKDVLALGTSLSTRHQLLDLVHEYEEYKRINESMDFGDQVALAARLAETVPLVGELERERFKVVLLDEYQDTSYAQIRFLSALYGKGHPVTAVGDPNQSIYAWRGASAAGPARFPEQFRNSDGTMASVFKLSTSWRNDERILEVANATSKPLFEADKDNSLPALQPRPNAGVGSVSIGYYETIEDEAEAIAQHLKQHWKPGVYSAAVLCRKRSQFPLLESTLRAHGIPVEVIGLGGLLATPEVVDLVAFLEAAHDPSRGDSVMRLLTGPRFNLGAADLVALGTYARNLSRSASRRAQAFASASGNKSDREDAETIAIDPFEERSILDALAELPRLGGEVPRELEGITFTDAGMERMRDLNQSLEHLRSLTYLPLPELVEAAIRTLSLDVEMTLATARSRRAGAPFDPTNPFGRAHLDALKRVAAQFSDSAVVPTLGAFLAWLKDAVSQERGLERPVGRPDPNAVALITVHASKGLEWDVVAVPGLSDGQFPGTATLSAGGPKDSAWLTDLGALPYPLRGDARDLPQLDYSDAEHDKDVDDAISRFKLDAGDQYVMDERRLAYVAFTRAKSNLFLTGAWWRTAVKPSFPSPFMSELVDNPHVTQTYVAPEPDPDSENPRNGEVLEAHWPFELHDEPTHSILQKAETADPRTVLDALAALPTQQGPAGSGVADEQRTAIARTLAVTRLAARIVANTVATPEVLDQEMRSSSGVDLVELADVLLRERDVHVASDDQVEFPDHISVSGIVDIDRDRAAYALARRRPIPREPSIASRRGTTFHVWVENFYGSHSLFDLDDLPGADDDYLEADQTLDQLKSTFESSHWASLTPVALERDIDIVVAGVAVRARIDAVFEDPERPGGIVVVDWKTGRAPTDAAERASRELQLALYRIAWSEATGTSLDLIDAAFYYVASNDTVRPSRLATKEEIESIIRGEQEA